jgi:hypothetical protein
MRSPVRMARTSCGSRHVDVELFFDLLEAALGVLEVDVEVLELGARDPSFLASRVLGEAVAAHAHELALELVPCEADPRSSSVAPASAFSTLPMRLFSFCTILSIVFLLRRISSRV